MRRMWMGICLVWLLAATACGSVEQEVEATAEGEVGVVPVAEPEEVDEASASSTTTSSAETTSSPPLEPENPDPCTVDQEVGVEEFEIDVEGELRPVSIQWDRAAANAESPGVLVGFHGAGLRGRDQTPIDGVKEAFPIPLVVVVPSASNAAAPFWSESPTFNRSYLEELYALLDTQICFDPDDLFLVSQGQGNMVATTAICDTERPIRTSYQVLGPYSFEDCAPSRPVPLFSLGIFDFNAASGAHWDGDWDPPVEYELERTGGIGSGPDEIDAWAEIYNCVGDPIEEAIPDPGDVLERDTEFYAYEDCDAPIYGFGAENGDTLCGCPNEVAVSALSPKLLSLAAPFVIGQ